MDQFSYYMIYKKLLKKTDFTALMASPYNFTGADDILNEFNGDLYPFDNFRNVILVVLYALIFIVALIGNLLVVVSTCGDSIWKKAKNYFLLNLTLADMSVAILCMPMAVGTIVYRLWVYGTFLCKFTAFMQGVAVINGIFTLMVMSVDRYLSIQHSSSIKRYTPPRQALLVLLVIWIVAAIIMGPTLFIREVDILEIPNLATLQFCIENWPQTSDREAYSVFLLFVVYIIPTATLCLCYARIGRTLCSKSIPGERLDGNRKRLVGRKRTAKMLIILVMVFIACWLPYNIVSLILDVWGYPHPLDIIPFALWLGHAHSAINPLMYWLLNKRFRRKIRKLFRRSKNCAEFQNLALPQYV